MIVMRKPFSKNSSQMFLAERNHETQALAPDGSNQSFTVRIGLRRSHRGSQRLQAETLNGFIHLLREDAVAIMDQEAIVVVAGNGLAELLCRPIGRRVSGHVIVQDSSRVHLHEHQNVQDAEVSCHHGGKITGENRVCMVLHKGHPALG